MIEISENSSSQIMNKLNSYRTTVIKLIAMEDEIIFWRNRLKHLNTLGLPPESEKNIDNIIKKLIAQIELGLRRCLCLRAECIYIIEEIPNPSIKQVLYLRYINGLSLEKIGEQMNYCIRHVTRLQNRGIELLKQKDVIE